MNEMQLWLKEDAFIFWDCLHEAIELQGGFFEPTLDNEENTCIAEQLMAIKKQFT